MLWVNQFAATPGDGGGTRHFELARALAALGWEVDIVASDFHIHRRVFTHRTSPGDHQVIEERVDGIRFLWLWAFPYRQSNWRRMLNWISFAWEVGRRPERISPADVVIGSSPQLFAALGAWLLAWRRRAPFVFEVRDLWPESLEAVSGRRGIGYWVLDRLATFLYRRADRIIVLARGSASAIEARGVPPTQICYVPNGVDPTGWPAIERPDRASFTSLYAGAHGPANGLEVVLDAAERLLARPEFRFLLVGDGPVKSQLQADAARRQLTNVEFRSSVAKTALPALFAEADAGLMVLRDTPLFAWGISPNKLFDYLAAQLPVVCNVPGDVAAMVVAAGAGEQARDSSADALVEALVRLSQRSPDERREMGRAGRRWVSVEHDRVGMARRLAQLFVDLKQS